MTDSTSVSTVLTTNNCTINTDGTTMLVPSYFFRDARLNAKCKMQSAKLRSRLYRDIMICPFTRKSDRDVKGKE